VTLRDPNLHAVTKAGYFAPAMGAPVDPQQQMMVNLVEAARSTIPFQALNLAVEDVPACRPGLLRPGYLPSRSTTIT
jgi:hypothetical protein